MWMDIEGVRFRETSEQYNQRKLSQIADKNRRCEILSDSDYEFLKHREQKAAQELAEKMMLNN